MISKIVFRITLEVARQYIDFVIDADKIHSVITLI